MHAPAHFGTPFCCIGRRLSRENLLNWKTVRQNKLQVLNCPICSLSSLHFLLQCWLQEKTQLRHIQRVAGTLSYHFTTGPSVVNLHWTLALFNGIVTRIPGSNHQTAYVLDPIVILKLPANTFLLERDKLMHSKLHMEIRTKLGASRCCWLRLTSSLPPSFHSWWQKYFFLSLEESELKLMNKRRHCLRFLCDMFSHILLIHMSLCGEHAKAAS